MDFSLGNYQPRFFLAQVLGSSKRGELPTCLSAGAAAPRPAEGGGQRVSDFSRWLPGVHPVRPPFWPGVYSGVSELNPLKVELLAGDLRAARFCIEAKSGVRRLGPKMCIPDEQLRFKNPKSGVMWLLCTPRVAGMENSNSEHAVFSAQPERVAGMGKQ